MFSKGHISKCVLLMFLRGKKKCNILEHISPSIRETKSSVISPTPGEVPLSQVPQIGTLDHQVVHSHWDQAVIAV